MDSKSAGLQWNREEARHQFATAEPFRFVKIDDFLDRGLAEQAADSYPSFEDAMVHGRTFKALNEQKKVQVTNATLFPPPVARLNSLLASPGFLTDLSYVTGIPDLLADEQLVGGGMHLTGPGGRLDVHVDFNFMEDRKLHRRLNLLLYLNPVWGDLWGGQLQLWDQDVTACRQTFAPRLNRCVIFETSDISFHGVVPVTAPAPYPRISFAAYYYTREAPPNWDGKVHSTIFRARPKERIRGLILMPAAKIRRQLSASLRGVKGAAKRLVYGSTRRRKL